MRRRRAEGCGPLSSAADRGGGACAPTATAEVAAIVFMSCRATWMQPWAVVISSAFFQLLLVAATLEPAAPFDDDEDEEEEEAASPAPEEEEEEESALGKKVLSSSGINVPSLTIKASESAKSTIPLDVEALRARTASMRARSREAQSDSNLLLPQELLLVVTSPEEEVPPAPARTRRDRCHRKMA